MINLEHIDGGAGFDWGKTSEDYAKYRDIYPSEFYQKILDCGLCAAGQRVLDLGTGTGVLPRNLYRYGASFVGTDIAENQIEQARRLSAEAGMDIEYRVCPAEEIDFDENSLDAVTACQCFFYFDTDRLLPKLRSALRPGGKLAILFCAWLPEESDIARRSEELVLRYSPDWTGAGMTREPWGTPDWAEPNGFAVEINTAFDVQIPFTRESWTGRMKACRGVGASLSPERVKEFEREHMALLERTAPEQFEIVHHTNLMVLKNRK